MASSHPHDVLIDTVIRVSFAAVILLAAFMLRATWQAAPGAAPCSVQTCLPSGRFITWHDAWDAKRNLQGQVLIVDVRARKRVGSGSLMPAFDAHVPFLEDSAAKDDPGAMTFHTDFALGVDEALRASNLKHDAPVMVLCESRRCGELAAVLLEEHGYSHVFAIVGDVSR
jgi:rhodanese-related sulfurtransferase